MFQYYIRKVLEPKMEAFPLAYIIYYKGDILLVTSKRQQSVYGTSREYATLKWAYYCMERVKRLDIAIFGATNDQNSY